MTTTEQKFSRTETFDADAPMRVDSVKIVWEDDGDPDSSYLEQDGWQERLAQYRRGDFGFVGCYAVATVSYPIGQGSRRLESFRSGGLWGIESDAAREYMAEIERQELDCLTDHLARFGVKLPYVPLATLYAGRSRTAA